MTDEGQTWVAGADGYRDGWIVVLWETETSTVRRRTVKTFEALLDLPETPAVLGVDVVIGLPEEAEAGGRACDRAARQLLGWPRSSSVFSPPAAQALQADSYDDAQRLNRASGPDAPGMTLQTYHLFPKMRAVAAAMSPTRQQRVREVHPELAFYAMNGDASVSESKHTEAGQTRRAALLAKHGFSEAAIAAADRPGAVGVDDLLDAHAVCWTARRLYEGTAQRLPPGDDVPTNDRGLRMEIWR